MSVEQAFALFEEAERAYARAIKTLRERISVALLLPSQEQIASAPLEDVLDALMLEEPDPSYNALLRWSERYPEHRSALTSFFATWATQAELPQEPVGDEERLANLGVSHALDILHRRDEAVMRPPPRRGTRGRAKAGQTR